MTGFIGAGSLALILAAVALYAWEEIAHYLGKRRIVRRFEDEVALEKIRDQQPEVTAPRVMAKGAGR